MPHRSLRLHEPSNSKFKNAAAARSQLESTQGHRAKLKKDYKFEPNISKEKWKLHDEGGLLKINVFWYWFLVVYGNCFAADIRFEILILSASRAVALCWCCVSITRFMMMQNCAHSRFDFAMMIISSSRLDKRGDCNKFPDFGIIWFPKLEFLLEEHYFLRGIPDRGDDLFACMQVCVIIRL